MNGEALARLLVELATAAPGRLVTTLDRHLADLPWYGGSRLLVADYGDRALVDPHGKAQPLAPGDPATAAYRGCRIAVDPERGVDAVVVRVPLMLRADCIGLVEVSASTVPGDDDLAALDAVGHLLGHVLWAGKHQLEFVERARRVEPMAVSAEIQWDLLSGRVEVGPGYAAAGWLEPAYDVGGDAFDLAVDVGVLWVSCIDAMGHGLHAGVTSGLALSAIRNARRGGGGVAEQAHAVNEALLRLWQGERFATMLLLRIDVATGDVEAVNAGHPPARLVHGGDVETLRLSVDLPPGLAGDTDYRSQRFHLRPGDRLVALSDGVAEAAAVGSAPYGPDRVEDDLRQLAGDPPQVAARELGWRVLRHADDRLRDDATVVCTDWTA